MINEYTQPIASLYILSIILLFLCTCSRSLLCSCWQHPQILRHLSSAQHLSHTFSEKYHQLSLHCLIGMNLPPVCSSPPTCAACTLCFGTKIHTDEFQGQGNTKLSDPAAWAWFCPVTKIGPYKCLAWILDILSRGWFCAKTIEWLKRKGFVPWGHEYAYMIIFHIDGL